MARSQAWTWLFGCIATVSTFLMAAAVGFRIEMTSFVLWMGVISSLASVHVFYGVTKRSATLAHLLGTTAATCWSLSLSAMLALAGLGVGAPLIDGPLIAIDRMFLLDAKATVTWLSQWEVVVALLAVAYESSVPLVLVTMLTLVFLSQPERAWRFCACITGSALACALVSAAYPAIGAFVGLQMPPDVLARLPDGAGTYHLPAFEAYRDGSLKILDIATPAGVITFPSFHTAMAVATAYAWSATRYCAVPMALWNAVVIISTIPIGGHYFVDLVAGGGLCVALLVLTRSRGSEIQPLSMATGKVSSQVPNGA